MTPLPCLCLFLGFGWGAFLFLRNLLLHLYDQFLQLLLALLPRVGVHVSCVLLAVGPDGRVAAFKQVVVELADTAGAGPAHAAAVGFEVGHARRLRRRGGRCRALLFLRLRLDDAAVDVGRGRLAHVVGNVGVDVQRGGGRHVAQHGRERLHIHTVLQRERREGVAQVVETHMPAPGVLQNELEPLAHRAGRHGTVVLHRRGKHPAGVHGLFVIFQDRDHRRRQNQFADGGFCFRRAELNLPVYVVDLLVDVQLAGLEIQVVPPERHQLAAAQAGGEIQEEQLVVALRLGLDEKPLQLLPVEHLHLPRLLGRQLAADGGIRADEAVVHRPLQRRAGHGVAHAHHPVGQAVAVQLGETHAARLFEPCVKLLQVVLRQLVQRNLSDLRDDVRADAVLIIDLRGGAELWLGVILVPVFQPVPEGHIGAQPFGLQSAAAIPERLEFFQTLRFCFREDVFGFGVAVVVVADDDAALPAPVLAQTDSGKVAHVEMERLLHKFTAAFAVVGMQPAVHARHDGGIQPKRGLGFDVFFHFALLTARRRE